jgi:hypothetical protein
VGARKRCQWTYQGNGGGGATAVDLLDCDDDDADVCMVLDDDDSEGDAENDGQEGRKRKKRSGHESKQAGSDFPSCPRVVHPIVPFLSHLYFALDPSTSVASCWAKALPVKLSKVASLTRKWTFLVGHASLMLSTDSVMLQGTAIGRLSDASPNRRSPVLLCRVIEAFAALQGLNPDCICLAIP